MKCQAVDTHPSIEDGAVGTYAISIGQILSKDHQLTPTTSG